MQELTSNHRQSGETSWSDSLNILRKGTDDSAVNGVYEQLKTRLGKMSGESVSEAQFDGAMRLYPTSRQG